MNSKCNQPICGGMGKRITDLRSNEKELRDELRSAIAEVDRLQKIVDIQAKGIKLIQGHCRRNWNRGNTMGLAAAGVEARGAVNRLNEEIAGRATDNAKFTEEIMGLEGLLMNIGDFAHDRSTGPAVPDALWEIRRMAYEGFINKAVI